MYCTNCGTPNEDGATCCTNCDYEIPHFPEDVPNYVTQAILVTLCCCVPFGIPAIFFAAQVNTKLQAGDVAGAIESSNKARNWCWIAFGCGAVIAAAYVGSSIISVLLEP
jgi:hypothetical protein